MALGSARQDTVTALCLLSQVTICGGVLFVYLQQTVSVVQADWQAENWVKLAGKLLEECFDHQISECWSRSRVEQLS